MSLFGKKKLFVFALQPHVEENKNIYLILIDKLKKIGLIGLNSVLENKQWKDIYLPRLHTEDLHQLKVKFGQQVEILATEDTSKGMGDLARKLGKDGITNKKNFSNQ